MDYAKKAPYGPRPALTEQVRQFLDSNPHGWCSREKAQMLCRLVTEYQPSYCLEIGVFGGASLIPIGMALREVGKGGIAVGVDPWDNAACLEGMEERASIEWWGRIDLNSIKASCQTHIQAWNLEKWVQLIQGKAEDVQLGEVSIGLLHLDGNHCEASSLGDVRKFLPAVTTGGHVVMDDVNWTEKGKRTQARSVDEVSKVCSLVGSVDSGNCLIFKKG